MANDFPIVIKTNNVSSATFAPELNLDTYFLLLQNNRTFFSNFHEV